MLLLRAYQKSEKLFPMDAIKQILGILFFIPFLTFGQKSIYPKDTIYVKFKNQKKWYGDYGYGKLKKKGILFNLKDNYNQSMSFFYDFRKKSDTLCIKYLKDYTFSNLKEINKKEIAWIDRKYANYKYKPYSGSKNGVFQTYLIEVISREKFVIYPVIWRNEGDID